MKKQILSAVTGVALAVGVLFASTAHAATFNFIDMADDNSDPNYFGERGFSTLDVTVGGINLKATGTATDDDDPNQFAYLDAGNAGLGVCKDLTGSNQCTPSSDDNVTANETLTFTFVSDVILSDFIFKNAGHGNQNSGSIDVSIDGAAALNISLADWTNFNGLTGKVFDFINAGSQFYIGTVTVSAVPLPAALPLYGAGIALLGFLGWRKRKQA